MKKILFVLIAFFCIAPFRLWAQELADLEAYEKAMKPGVQITYDVTANGKQFKMMLTIKKTGTDLAFDWKTTDPDNKSGSVSMSPNALSAAKAFSHIFKGGETKLDNETSLWASRQVCNDIMANAQATVKVNGAGDTATVMSNTMDVCNVTLNGNLVGLSGWELQGGNAPYTIAILESVKFPLIYKLDIGWTMVLSEIKN